MELHEKEMSNSVLLYDSSTSKDSGSPKKVRMGISKLSSLKKSRLAESLLELLIGLEVLYTIINEEVRNQRKER